MKHILNYGEHCVSLKFALHYYYIHYIIVQVRSDAKAAFIGELSLMPTFNNNILNVKNTYLDKISLGHVCRCSHVVDILCLSKWHAMNCRCGTEYTNADI